MWKLYEFTVTETYRSLDMNPLKIKDTQGLFVGQVFKLNFLSLQLRISHLLYSKFVTRTDGHTI